MAEAFYPADIHELDTLTATLLDRAIPEYRSNKRIRAIITPHSGYLQSGTIAACAYKALSGFAYDRVFLLGNAHAYLFRGIALDWQKA